MVFPVVVGNAHEPLVRPVHADDVAIGQVRPGFRARHQIDELLAKERPPFDRDIYKILAKQVGRMTPLPAKRFPSS